MARGCKAKSVAGSVAYLLIAWIVGSLVSGERNFPKRLVENLGSTSCFVN
jgi:hypothetical protein